MTLDKEDIYDIAKAVVKVIKDKDMMKSEENDCSENFKEIMYDKITSGIDLTESELKGLACEFPFYEIEKDRDSFTVDTQSIVKLRDKYFAINWQQGLEDFEDSKFGAQPYEVKKVNRMTTEWIPVKQDS